MSDFMLWLYANYIRPQIGAVEKDGCGTKFYIVEKELSPAARISLERSLEFTAIQVFLLGFRTSEGHPCRPGGRRPERTCFKTAPGPFAPPTGKSRAGHGSSPCPLCCCHSESSCREKLPRIPLINRTVSGV